jgi:dephospho-CoA kinase
MLLIGLTGGIGSGKSTVAAALSAKGAVVIDADQVARQVVEPGGPAYAGVVERFGPGVVGAGGRLDRGALAAIVFSDPEALADLNRLTHPAIGQVIAERALAHAAGGSVVIIDAALLDAGARDRYHLDAVLVVDTPPDVAIARLVSQRGLTEDDARARVAAQMGRDERRALADLVIDNSEDRRHLDAEVERAWRWIARKAAGGVP